MRKTQTQTILTRLGRGPATSQELADSLRIPLDNGFYVRISAARRFLREHGSDVQIVYSPVTGCYSLSGQWMDNYQDARTWTNFRQPSVLTQIENLHHAVSNGYNNVSRRTSEGRIVKTVLSSLDNAKNAIELLGDVLVSV